ncbi:degT/dnrJ/eryC1/strS aminotransferase [Bombiscardovia coagulans]|uniref:DegT/dnrJ/eryC1/strS aminotransferase n=1 Tax=Bombiscardovia coagulans TaxID=686666 RepID=A0A261EVJ4_9BIFI|nr:degT/dnrJ/eryC1/strS aminotransferase [Bombiscardovia coagulans]
MLLPSKVLTNPNLIINGGSPTIQKRITEDTGIDTQAFLEVAEVVKSGHTQYWGGGPKTHSLEKSFAKYVGREFAFFHNSGTAALQTALFASGVNEGDSVAVTSSGFIAS